MNNQEINDKAHNLHSTICFAKGELKTLEESCPHDVLVIRLKNGRYTTLSCKYCLVEFCTVAGRMGTAESATNYFRADPRFKDATFEVMDWRDDA